MQTEKQLVLEPGGGERLRFLGDSTLFIKTAGNETDGALAFYEYISQPGVTSAPQHVHHGHDETFYIVHGHFEFTLGTATVTADPGSFLVVPRGTPHTFRNAGDGEGRFVSTSNPARFAQYFQELAEIIERTGAAPGREDWIELYGRYDTTFYDEH